jgi:hypothetical protein
MRELSRQRGCGQWLSMLATGVLAVHLNASGAKAQQRQVPSPSLVPAASPPSQDRSPPAPATLSRIHGPASASNRAGTPSIANGGRQHSQRRAVERDVAARVAVGSGMLVLPTVAYFGVPIILDVPDLGYVELSEERYAELYGKLLSVDPEQVQEAIAALRQLKAAEEAEIEALQHGPRLNADAPSDDLPAVVERDLSEPVSFGRLPFKIQVHRRPTGLRGLY